MRYLVDLSSSEKSTFSPARTFPLNLPKASLALTWRVSTASEVESWLAQSWSASGRAVPVVS